MKRERFASVWDAIEDDPGMAENLRLRSLLMIALKRHIESEELTQQEAAKLLCVTQPRISNLMHGKIEAFGLDMLVKMATSAGLKVNMKVRRAA